MKFVSRTKEHVTHKYFLDGLEIYESSRSFLMFVYCRSDGSEFINQRHPHNVTRIDGLPCVVVHAKTIKPIKWQELFLKIQHKAQMESQ